MTLAQEQLNIHKTHITASQVPTIMGLNPFETRHELLVGKFRRGDKPRITSDAIERGDALEEPVARLCLSKLGCTEDELWPAGVFLFEMNSQELINDEFLVLDGSGRVTATLKSKNAPDRFAASSDFIIVKGDINNPDREFINYEIKTSNGPGWSNGETPRKVIIQCQWQMAILRSHGINCTKSYVGALIKGRHTVRVVEYDQELLMDAVRAVQAFLDELEAHRAAGTVPAYDDDPDARQGAPSLPVDDLGEPDSLELLKIAEVFDRQNATKKEVADAKKRGVRLLERLGVGSIKGESFDVVYYGPRETTRTNQSKMIEQLEGKLRRLGYGDFCDEVRESSRFTRRGAPYIQIRSKQ